MLSREMHCVLMFRRVVSAFNSLFSISSAPKKNHLSTRAHRQEHWEAPTKHARYANMKFIMSPRDDRLMGTRYEIEMKRQTGESKQQQYNTIRYENY